MSIVVAVRQFVTFIFALLFVSSPHAEEIFSTAPPTGMMVSEGGYLIDEIYWVGARFHLDQATTVTSVGVELAALDSGSFFAALIAMPVLDPIDETTQVPFFDPSASSLEAAAISSATKTLIAADFSVAFELVDFDMPDATLGPGDYGLVIGSGAFQTSGYGLVAATLDDLNKEFFFTSADMTFVGGGIAWLGFNDSPDVYGARLVVNGFGQQEPPIPVPEPPILWLLGGAMVGLALVRRGCSGIRSGPFGCLLTCQ